MQNYTPASLWTPFGGRHWLRVWRQRGAVAVDRRGGYRPNESVPW